MKPERNGFNLSRSLKQELLQDRECFGKVRCGFDSTLYMAVHILKQFCLGMFILNFCNMIQDHIDVNRQQCRYNHTMLNLRE